MVWVVALLQERERDPAGTATCDVEGGNVELGLHPVAVLGLEEGREPSDVASVDRREVASHRHRGLAGGAGEVELDEPREAAQQG